MGNKILIYENGQRYEIDSDQIYVPEFTLDLFSNTLNGKLIPGIKYQRENKDDTVSEDEDKDDKPKITNQVT